MVNGSLFVEAVGKILASDQPFILNGTTLTDTYNQTMQAVTILTPLRLAYEERPTHQNLFDWAVEIDEWITRANVYLDVCRAAAAAALPVVIQ